MADDGFIDQLKAVGSKAGGVFTEAIPKLLSVPVDLLDKIAKDPGGAMLAASAGLFQNPQANQQLLLHQRDMLRRKNHEDLVKFAVGIGLPAEKAQLLPLDVTTADVWAMAHPTLPHYKAGEIVPSPGAPGDPESGVPPGYMQIGKPPPKPLTLSQAEVPDYLAMSPEDRKKMLLSLPEQRLAGASLAGVRAQDIQATQPGRIARTEAQAEQVMQKTLRGEALLPYEIDAADVKVADIRDKMKRRQALTPLEEAFLEARTARVSEQTAEGQALLPGRIAKLDADTAFLVQKTKRGEALMPEDLALAQAKVAEINQRIRKGQALLPGQQELLQQQVDLARTKVVAGQTLLPWQAALLQARTATEAERPALLRGQEGLTQARTATEAERQALIRGQTALTVKKGLTEDINAELKRGQIVTQELKDRILEIQPGILQQQTQAKVDLLRAQSKVKNGEILLQRDKHALNQAALAAKKFQKLAATAANKVNSGTDPDKLPPAERDAYRQTFQKATGKVPWPTGESGRVAISKAEQKLGRAPTPEEAWREFQLLPTSTTRTMQESAPKVIGRVARIRQLINQLVAEGGGRGPLSARWRDIMTGRIGLSNPTYQALRTDVNLLTTQLMRMHVGARGGEYVMKHFDEIFGLGKQSLDNVEAALGETELYANEVAHGGTPELLRQMQTGPTGNAVDDIYNQVHP